MPTPNYKDLLQIVRAVSKKGKDIAMFDCKSPEKFDAVAIKQAVKDGVPVIDRRSLGVEWTDEDFEP